MGIKGYLVGGVVGSFIENMIVADKNDAKAEEINIKSLNRMGDAQREQMKQEEKTQASLIKLATRKKAILISSIDQFLSLYEKIIKIDFQTSEGIKELFDSKFTPTIIQDMKTVTSVAATDLNTNQIVATMLIKGGLSGVIAKESELNLNVAYMRNKQARVIEAQIETICVVLDAMYQRAEKLCKVLTALNVLLIDSLKYAAEIIDKNGFDRNNYNQHDRDSIMTCINIASTVKKIIDAPLIDQEGEITLQSLEAIEIGEAYLKEITYLSH